MNFRRPHTIALFLLAVECPLLFAQEAAPSDVRKSDPLILVLSGFALCTGQPVDEPDLACGAGIGIAADLPRFRIGETELVSYRVGVDRGVAVPVSGTDGGEDRATASRTSLHVSREFATTNFVSTRVGVVATYTGYGRGVAGADGWAGGALVGVELSPRKAPRSLRLLLQGSVQPVGDAGFFEGRFGGQLLVTPIR